MVRGSGLRDADRVKHLKRDGLGHGCQDRGRFGHGVDSRRRHPWDNV